MSAKPSSPSPPPPRWSAEDSRALDLEIRRLRKDQTKRERRALGPPERKNKNTPPAQPVQVGSGRWRIKVTVSGKTHRARFDTKEDAIAWRDRITKPKET